MDEDRCDCCEGTQPLTPKSTANRPGLDALLFRVGTQAEFLQTMQARLSSMPVEVESDQAAALSAPVTYPLQYLTTRAQNDPAIALLDGWATVADVLTFYQERIANEGYLRTATERRSVLELARLVGYALRPGVASTVYLAYTIDEKHKEPVEIPIGSRAQSVPVGKELPQSFETADKLEARAAWNTLKVRMTRPQTRASIENVGPDRSQWHQPRIYLKGIATNLRLNDPLLIDFGDGTQQFTRVQAVEPDPAANRTLVKLQPWLPPETPAAQPLTAAAAAREINAVVQEFMIARAGQLNLIGTPFYDNVKAAVKTLLEPAALDPNSDIFREVRLALPRLNILVQPVAPAGTRRARTRAAMAADASQNWLTEFTAALESTNRRLLEAWGDVRVGDFIPGKGGILTQPINPLTAVDVDKSQRRIVGDLIKPPSIPPRNEQQVKRSGESAFQSRSDTGFQLLSTTQQDLSDNLPVAVANARVAADNPITVYALRATARPFGHNAPPRSIVQQDFNQKVRETTVRYVEWDLDLPFDGSGGYDSTGIERPHSPNILSLDAEYAVSPDSWVVIEMPAPPDAILTAAAGGPDAARAPDPLIVNLRERGGSVSFESLAGYGISGKSTRLNLGTLRWFSATGANFSVVRKTTIHTQSEVLELVEEPIVDPVPYGQRDWLELDEVYSDLKFGRWLIVSGERVDVTTGDPARPEIVAGIKASELVMLAEVIQSFEQTSGEGGYGYPGYGPEALPGERAHTYIRLVKPLEYTYRRDSVTIYGNVVKATHGETRNESLGNGDGSKAFQSFTLKQPPLTYTAAPTAAGAQSTLKVYVSEVEWHEVDMLSGLGPTDHKFITKTGDDDKTTVIFGNGWAGARLPTGIENVKSTYRFGIGKVGNVKAEQVSLLVSRPLGVQAVINPMRASGGADRESRDQARRHVPLAALALDRLVSVQDYEDFARKFAGIGKAAAVQLSNGQRQLVHLTIAGADDVPIDVSSDLYQNFVRALRLSGDSHQPLQVDSRELAFLIISASVRPLPDYLWEKVSQDIRTKLLDIFSFERRELGQDALLSEAIAAIQSVKGVAYVDVDVFGSVSEKVSDNGRRRLRTAQEIAAAVKQLFDEHTASRTRPADEKLQPRQRVTADMAHVDRVAGGIVPAQLAFLVPDVPDTLLLNRI